MNAGQELDALIAEKVMGDVPGQALGPKPYSTDITAAWTVVERMGWPIELNGNGTQWRCELGIGWAYASSAPLAICLAALKAVGMKTVSL